MYLLPWTYELKRGTFKENIFFKTRKLNFRTIGPFSDARLVYSKQMRLNGKKEIDLEIPNSNSYVNYFLFAIFPNKKKIKKIPV